MLDVTPDDILALRDDELRELVARLCTAELGAQSLPSAAVTAGGHRDAKDRGIDVRIALDVCVHPNDTSRASTSNSDQGPRHDRPIDRIRDASERVFRPSSGDIAARGSVYILAVAKGTLADAGLDDRKAAMCKAVTSDRRGLDLLVDFYDHDRLARLTRDNAGVSMWVLNKVGRVRQSWRSVEMLTNEPAGTSYLLDAGCNIFDSAARRSAHAGFRDRTLGDRAVRIEDGRSSG